MNEPNLEAALSAIPVFPLPHVVLFPGALLPLHVFEPRYRKMLADCLSSHRAIAIAQVLAGEDDQGRPRIASICGGGIIVEHQPLADGRSNIMVLGKARLRLDELPVDALPYRRARADVLNEVATRIADSDRAALVAAATMFAAEVKKHDPSFSFRLPSSDDASVVCDVCAFHLVIDPASRQAILEELDPRTRLEMVVQQLALQHSALMRDSNDDKSALN